MQRELTLRYKDGKIAKDPKTGTGRRLDVVGIKGGKGRFRVEVTSKTADKAKQVAKEDRIMESGGHFVKDRSTGNIVDISNAKSIISRRK